MAIAHATPGHSFQNEVWALLAFAIVFVVLRCLARIQVTGIRKLRLDDWGMTVAVTLFAFTVSCARLIAATTDVDATVNPNNLTVALNPALANNGMTDDYRANLDPASVEYQLRVAGSKLHLTAWSFYVSTLWCVKLCIAVFYTRLIDGLSHMKIRIQIAYVAIGVSYVVVMGTIFGACQPFNHYWQINPNPGDQCMPAVSMLTCCVVVVLNALTDIYLLHIPIHMLWNAQISRVKKFFLIMLFSGGIFVIMAGILRAYFILSGGRVGGAQAAYWGTREAFVAFVIGNVPMIYGGCRIWLRKIKDSKFYKRIRSRTKDWPWANRFSALFSGTAGSRFGSASEKHPPGKNFVMLNVTDASNSSSEPSRQSPLAWGTRRSDSRIDTKIDRSDSPRTDTDPEFGIQVTRGIKIDVESVKSRDSEPETCETVAQHSRTDSQAQLGPFLDSPSEQSNRRRVSELPSDDRPVRRSILLIPSSPQQQRRSGTPDGPNDTKWISDGSS